MIKLPLPLRHSAAVAVAFTALCGLSLTAAPVDNWTQNHGTAISDLNTNHPVVGDGTIGSVKNQQMYAVIPSYTLASVGDSLSFTGNANFQGVASASADQFRFGVYDSNGKASTATPVNGWLGYFASNAGGGTASRLWKRPDPNTVSFGSNGWGTPSNPATPAAWAGSQSSTLVSGDYSFSMVLTKTADGINIAWSIVSLSEGSNHLINGNWLDTNADAFTFDRVGFFVGGSLNAEQISFSDLEINFAAIPEPATTAALLGLVVGGALLLRRRAKRV